MADLSKAIQMQEFAAEDYADARDRFAGPDRDALIPYIVGGQDWAAWFSHKAREAIGITEKDYSDAL